MKMYSCLSYSKTTEIHVSQVHPVLSSRSFKDSQSSWEGLSVAPHGLISLGKLYIWPHAKYSMSNIGEKQDELNKTSQLEMVKMNTIHKDLQSIACQLWIIYTKSKKSLTLQ